MLIPPVCACLLLSILLPVAMLRGVSSLVRRTLPRMSPAHALPRSSKRSLLLRPFSAAASSEGGAAELVAGLEVELKSGGRYVRRANPSPQLHAFMSS